ncbi:hypothetical protein EVAR_39156_1 [Eumeta japonica]|uniref:Uncharacterized protein n=1 Tax=Eumeta variegata TaxID=151549 RepID=A0A4C1X7P3_EUMVA|nr:hypothetical protein EVAR_39156_1 [Eumeta japonica]
MIGDHLALLLADFAAPSPTSRSTFLTIKLLRQRLQELFIPSLISIGIVNSRESDLKAGQSSGSESRAGPGALLPQLEELVDYMVAHPMLAKGVGLGPRSKETVDLLWAELTQRLNARVWVKKLEYSGRKIKTKASNFYKDIRGTGGGPPLYERLSEVEKKVLGILEEANHLDAPKTATLTKKDPKPPTRKKRKVDSWVIELEEHRIAAEEKMSEAAKVLADAAKTLADAAMLTAETTKTGRRPK